MSKENLPIGNIVSAKDVGNIAARKMQALTQADLAGLGQGRARFISDLENGKGAMQFGMIVHILDLLGFDVETVERDR